LGESRFAEHAVPKQGGSSLFGNVVYPNRPGMIGETIFVTPAQFFGASGFASHLASFEGVMIAFQARTQYQLRRYF
jgi:hypothetical protein